MALVGAAAIRDAQVDARDRRAAAQVGAGSASSPRSAAATSAAEGGAPSTLYERKAAISWPVSRNAARASSLGASISVRYKK
ncbi:hypothetical protein WME74_39810 [Sorangium sp. So ce341]